MKKSEKYNVAQEAFLKVISKRGDDAPESHLEVGAIYLDHIKDPFAAMYHLKKYRELKPNGANRDAVSDQIERAEKEIIRRVMQKVGSPVQRQLNELDYEDRIEKLQAENATLLSEITNLRRDLTAQSRTTSPVAPIGSVDRRATTAATMQPVQSVPTKPVQAVPNRAPVRTAPSPPPTAPPSSSGRTYVVQRGDNLYKISMQFYGTGRRVQEIYELNRDRLQSPEAVPTGVELRLP
jgi:nucleoid-associated protein YgaU